MDNKRLETLEELCELITKQIVTQNKCVIEANHNLIGEIRNLREIIARQDEDFVEFKLLLRKLYDLSIQNQFANQHLFAHQQQQQQVAANMVRYPPHQTQQQQQQQMNQQNNYLNQLAAYALPLQQQQQQQQQQQPQNQQQMQLNQQMQLPPQLQQHQHINPQIQQQLNQQLAAQLMQQQIQQQQQQQQQKPPVIPQPQQHQQPTTPTNIQKPLQNTFQINTQIGQPQPTKPTNVNQIEQQSNSNKPSASENGLSTPQTATSNKQIDFTNTFASAKGLPSFADLAKNTSTPFGGNTNSPFSLSKPTQHAILFANQSINNSATKQQNDDEDGDDGTGGGNPEEYEPQVDFKPLVKLQEVEVKTGEEDEEAMFKERCKLYRFDTNTKEWKEKGVGEMKILKHKTNIGQYRILMRRDQVHKLCANHRINNDLKFEFISEKQIRWTANDYSESNEPKYEILAAKFRNEADAKRFNEEIEKAKKAVEAAPKTTVPSTPVTAKPFSSLPSLADSVKIEKGTWSCSQCLAQNKANDVACACCQHPKANTNGTSNGNASQITNSNSFSVANSIKFENGPPKSNTNPALFSFGLKPNSQNTNSNEKEEAVTTPTQKSIDFSFGSKTLPSFADLAKKTNATGFNLATSSPFNSTPSLSKPGQIVTLFGNQSLNSIKQQNEDEDGDDGTGGGNPEEYEPQVDFKPLVKLQEVEVKTGEEDEEAMFKERCKLYRFDTNTKEWKEKGVGEMKILKHKTNIGQYRILMRRDQVHKLCANHRINNDLKFEFISEKQIRWTANDYSESNEPKYEILAAKFRNEADAKRFNEEIEKAKKAVEAAPKATGTTLPSTPVTSKPTSNLPSLTNSVKIEKGTWSCSQCLASNKPDSDKCACCQQTKPGVTKIEPTKPNDATPKTNGGGAGLFSFGSPSLVNSDLFAKPTTNGTPTTTGAQSNQNTILGALLNSSQQQNQAKPDFASVFSSKNMSSFGDLAKTTNNSGFAFGTGAATGSSFASPLFSGLQSQQPAMLFANQSINNSAKQQNEDEDGDDGTGGGNPEEYEPQVDFKPLVKLQEVEVKTGEEDEEAMFKERCKLYRFDTNTKEWKEKGVGEMKILKHKTNIGQYRILMRRDQVHKLCANHRINNDLKFEFISEKQIRWTANDYSESNEPKYEILAAKFRNEADAKRFNEEIEKAKKAAASAPAGSVIPKPSNSVNGLVNSLEKSLKIEKGTWSCSQCLVSNKPDSLKCACCQHPKETNNTCSASSDDNDIIITNVVKANAEQISKAKQYFLPENFYLYENVPECTGCRGCVREH